MLRSVIRSTVIATLLVTLIAPPVITQAFGHGSGGGGGGGAGGAGGGGGGGGAGGAGGGGGGGAGAGSGGGAGAGSGGAGAAGAAGAGSSGAGGAGGAGAGSGGAGGTGGTGAASSAAGAGSGGAGGGYGGGHYYAGAHSLPYRNPLGTNIPIIPRSKAWSGWVRDDTFYSFRERALRPRWDMLWRVAPVSDLHRLHKAQRTKLKPHDMRKMLSGQKPVQSFGVRTSLDARRRGDEGATAASRPVNRAPVEVQVAPLSLIDREVEQTIGVSPVDASADVVQVTPPPAIEGKSEQTIGRAPIDSSADVVQVIAPPLIERKGEQAVGTALVDASADIAQVTPPHMVEHDDASITRSFDGLVVMMMALVALGFIPLLLRQRYAGRVLAYAAIRRSEARADDARPVNLLCPPRIEADPSLVSHLEASVKNVLDTIREAEAEMASSRQLRRSA